MVILTPPPHKLRDLSRPVDTSFQVSTPDDAKMVEASLEEIPSTTSPRVRDTRAQQQHPSLRC